MNIVKECEKFAVSKFKKLKSPWRRWYYLHSKYVGISALEIMPKADKEIFLISGWLHDIAKVEKNEGHANRSAKLARKFLNGKVDKKKLKIIIDCIANHSRGSHPKTMEGKIIQNADKVSIFYPEVRRLIKKDDGREKMEEIIKEHYPSIKMFRAKRIAKNLLKIKV